MHTKQSRYNTTMFKLLYITLSIFSMLSRYAITTTPKSLTSSCGQVFGLLFSLLPSFLLVSLLFINGLIIQKWHQKSCMYFALRVLLIKMQIFYSIIRCETFATLGDLCVVCKCMVNICSYESHSKRFMLNVLRYILN